MRLGNHDINVTATQRRRYEVPLLHWQHWLPGGQTWKARHSKQEGRGKPYALQADYPNPAKRVFRGVRAV